MNINKNTTLEEFAEMIDSAQAGDQDLGDYLIALKKTRSGRKSYRMPLCFLMGLLMRRFPTGDQGYGKLTDDTAVGPGAQDFLVGSKRRSDVPTPKLKGEYWGLTESSTINDVYELIEDGKLKKDEIDIDQYLSVDGQEKRKLLLGILDDMCGESKNDSYSPKIKTVFPDSLVEMISQRMKGSNKQIVFTGAPGTGKTYCVRQYVEKNAEGRFEFIQFHSSYDYTDFVEGLRPVFLGSEEKPDCTFVKMDGAFKAFCRRIVAENKKYKADNGDSASLPDYYFIIDEINRADLSRVFGELMFSLEESYRGEKNIIKTQYQNLPTYYINEDEKTGIKKARVMVDDCFKDGFFIPENLYIVGTMNDIDRSVESFDFALRRRFQWIDIKANVFMGTSLKSMGVVDDPGDRLVKRIIRMNLQMDKSNLGLSDAYHIGAAYFKDYDLGVAEEILEKIFNERIEPILREYTRGRDKNSVNHLITSCRDALFGEYEEDD